MTLKELEKQLLALSPGEKTQAIQLFLSNTWEARNRVFATILRHTS
jgi:hypothetical protein